ncbi:MAG TPA: phosphoribosylformimino-5-aminoimidazole carboxamide ribotide isomerase [Fibrobacteraceae bacterium]|nr:phosphoribosylformimino-5-aminoimidazole carboxamide ribotide isomerase [Fibrobacteraceae bacterium]
MTRFRPCIDLHDGRVKQIVGGTLSDNGSGLQTNFVSDRSAVWYADLYRKDGLQGGHVILLGAGNEEPAREALAAYPGGLQVGGGITAEVAPSWLDAGASHVIVTSWIFQNGALRLDRLVELVSRIGRERLVLDLSCRRTSHGWNIATQRWQVVTEVQIQPKTLDLLSTYCAEFLIHAADVEGRQAGMDEDLIRFLAEHSPIPVTYAGGARNLEDLEHCAQISEDKVDLTIGSALDIFGGKGAAYADCVAYNRYHA